MGACKEADDPSIARAATFARAVPVGVKGAAERGVGLEIVLGVAGDLTRRPYGVVEPPGGPLAAALRVVVRVVEMR